MFCQVSRVSGTVRSVGRNGWREERVGRALWGGILMGWCGQSWQDLARSSKHPDGHPGQADSSDPGGQSRGHSLQRACWRLLGQDGSTGELTPQEQPSPTQDAQWSVVIWPLPSSGRTFWGVFPKLSSLGFDSDTLSGNLLINTPLTMFSFSLVSLSHCQNKAKPKLNKQKLQNYVYTNLCFGICFGEAGTEGLLWNRRHQQWDGEEDRLWSI